MNAKTAPLFWGVICIVLSVLVLVTMSSFWRILIAALFGYLGWYSLKAAVYMGDTQTLQTLRRGKQEFNTDSILNRYFGINPSDESIKRTLTIFQPGSATPFTIAFYCVTNAMSDFIETLTEERRGQYGVQWLVTARHARINDLADEKAIDHFLSRLKSEFNLNSNTLEEMWDEFHRPADYEKVEVVKVPPKSTIKSTSSETLPPAPTTHCVGDIVLWMGGVGMVCGIEGDGQLLVKLPGGMFIVPHGDAPIIGRGDIQYASPKSLLSQK